MDFEAARKEMVKRQILARGIRDRLVLKAMRSVPREEFVPSSQRRMAYRDKPLSIGADQTISQPYIVAFMIEALGIGNGDTVLEIGTGSGYAAAVASLVAATVYTVERVVMLADRAKVAMDSRGFENVHVLHGDGTLGWEEFAPYDAILVSAGGPSVPNSLKSQLKIGGRLVIPVGSTSSQELVRVTRESEKQFRTEAIANVRFVSLIGEEGWDASGR